MVWAPAFAATLNVRATSTITRINLRVIESSCGKPGSGTKQNVALGVRGDERRSLVRCRQVATRLVRAPGREAAWDRSPSRRRRAVRSLPSQTTGAGGYRSEMRLGTAGRKS